MSRYYEYINNNIVKCTIIFSNTYIDKYISLIWEIKRLTYIKNIMWVLCVASVVGVVTRPTTGLHHKPCQRSYCSRSSHNAGSKLSKSFDDIFQLIIIK